MSTGAFAYHFMVNSARESREREKMLWSRTKDTSNGGPVYYSQLDQCIAPSGGVGGLGVFTSNKDVIWAINQVYNELGSGHTENIYEAAMELELEELFSAPIRRQVPCPILYKGTVIGTGFIDILIQDQLIIEIKAVNKLSGKEEQQVRKYLSATGLQQGLLVNFGNTLEIVEVKGIHEQTIQEVQ